MIESLNNLQTYFPGRELVSVYDDAATAGKSGVVLVVDDWTFFQYGRPEAYESIVVRSAVEDFLAWSRLLPQSISRVSTAVYFTDIDSASSEMLAALLKQLPRCSAAGIRILNGDRAVAPTDE